MPNRDIQWRVYYADGTTFDSTMGEPEDAPGTRVLLIIQQHKDQRERAYFQWRDDYYLWKNGRWYATDYGALMFYWFIEKYDHPRAALAGETVDNDTFERVRLAAQADEDFF